MKIVYAYVQIEVLAEEDLMNGPLEPALFEDVTSFKKDLEGWLSQLDEYPNFELKITTTR